MMNFWGIVKGMFVVFLLSIVLLAGLQLAITGEVFIEPLRALGVWLVIVVAMILKHSLFKMR